MYVQSFNLAVATSMLLHRLLLLESGCEPDSNGSCADDNMFGVMDEDERLQLYKSWKSTHDEADKQKK
jgi:hypothetical protein